MRFFFFGLRAIGGWYIRAGVIEFGWGMKRRPPWGVGPLGKILKQAIPAVEPELRAQAVFSLSE